MNMFVSICQYTAAYMLSKTSLLVYRFTVQSLPIRQSKAYIELSSACTMVTPAMCVLGKAAPLPSAKVDAA